MPFDADPWGPPAAHRPFWTRWGGPVAFALAIALLIVTLILAGDAHATQVQIDPTQPDPSYGKSEPLTVGVPVGTTIGTYATPIRAVLIVCTVAGNVVLQLADGSSVTLTGLPIGIYLLPFQVTEVVSQTATATYYDLG